MSIFRKLRGELVDIIEWRDAPLDTMVYRFERYHHEIKNGAKLIVRPSQVAIFVNEGQLADVFEFPGTYTLATRNLPILSTLRGWPYGFQSPFKAEVYFVSTRLFTNLKWGTKNPVMLRDAEFGPVRLRAFGTYVMRVRQPATFLQEIVGAHAHFRTEGITDQLRDLIVARFADILGESKIPILDLAANYNELGDFLTKKIAPEFDSYGLELQKLLVENISLPPQVEEAMDKRSSMGILGNLSAYTQYQTGTAIGDAARNPGAGGAGAAGVNIGAGMVMAQQVGQAVGQAHAAQQAAQQASSAPVPPPIPAVEAVTYFVAQEGRHTGPFDMATLQREAHSGQLRRDTLVWKAGMAQWTAAGEVAELASLFVSVPPPVPDR